MVDPLEEWRPIPGWEREYEVSSIGRIRSLPRPTARGIRGGGLIKTPIKRNKRIAYLSRSGYLKQVYVGRMVALAFHGEPKPEQIACHLDGDPLNNLVSNIAWSDHGTNRNKLATHCWRGHLFDEANTYWMPKGYRSCRECRKLRQRKEYVNNYAGR
jgi:hypothetical protein